MSLSDKNKKSKMGRPPKLENLKKREKKEIKNEFSNEFYLQVLKNNEEGLSDKDCTDYRITYSNTDFIEKKDIVSTSLDSLIFELENIIKERVSKEVNILENIDLIEHTILVRKMIYGQFIILAHEYYDSNPNLCHLEFDKSRYSQAINLFKKIVDNECKWSIMSDYISNEYKQKIVKLILSILSKLS